MWKFLAFAATVLVACSSGGSEDVAEPPGVPGNVQASLRGAEVLVTWNAPSLPDDQPVIQYLISDGFGARLSAPPGRTRATFPQPSTGVIYEITVRAETANGNGIGDPSEPIAVTGRPGPALAPDQPIVEARNLRGFVEIVWTPPENDGGSLITGYVIEVEPTGRSYTFIGNPGAGYFLATNPSIRASASGTPVRFAVVLPDLNPGDSYVFRVIAENAIGKSEPFGLTVPITAGIGYGTSNPPVVSISPGPIPPTRTPTPMPLPTSTPRPATVTPTPRHPDTPAADCDTGSAHRDRCADSRANSNPDSSYSNRYSGSDTNARTNSHTGATGNSRGMDPDAIRSFRVHLSTSWRYGGIVQFCRTNHGRRSMG